MKKILIALHSFLLASFCFAQNETIPLWETNIPNSQVSSEVLSITMENILWKRTVQKPQIEIFLPSKPHNTGKAMLIFPGGGYTGLAYDWEGTEIAKWLNTKGIAAFVVTYRLPGSKSVVKRQTAPLQDAQRAIRLVRFHAKKWNIEADQIGIIGFSAGGHLAATLGTRFQNESLPIQDDIDEISARPDFMVLAYPVISMKESVTHQGSKDALLGPSPSAKLIETYSNELQVSTSTPPTFLVHATDDKVVPVENSLLFYQALKDSDVSVEMHIYPKGGHGFALAIGQGYLASWPDRLHDWILGLE